jgi:type II secretory pathway pseudopilin PulG
MKITRGISSHISEDGLPATPSPLRMEDIPSPLLPLPSDGRGRAAAVFRRSEVAFTMIEIAICLAVVGFALAAIIGVLPLGMSVQKENREETIINQDGNVFLNGIRNGELGLDDLTNYVVAITNWVSEYDGIGKPRSYNFGYNYTNSFQNGAPMSPPMGISNGFRIIGLLSTPRYTPMLTRQTFGFRSNYVVAYVRALSGNASEKFPQNNPQLQDLAFSYRMISDIVPYSEFDRTWTNFTDPLLVGNTNEITQRSNYWMLVKNMQTNLHDVRLIFRYPYLPNGKTGNGRIVFRTSVSGHLSMTNDMGLVNPTPPYQLYFFEPRTYMRASLTP